MKKSTLSNFTLFTVAIFIVSCIFIINSCKKDTRSISNNVNTKNLILDSSLVRQAKLWYQSAYPQTGTTKTAVQSIGGSGLHDWSQTFTPYWSKAQSYVKDSLIIVEIPVLKKGDMAFSKLRIDSNRFDFTKSPSVTSLLIVIDKGYINAYAMTIMADSSYIKGNYSKIKNNTYRQKEKDFTGLVFYNQMNGAFVNGWRYVNGAVMNAITQAVNNPPGSVIQSTRKFKAHELEAQGCTEIVTEYWENCTYYENDTFYEHPISCSYYTVTSSYSVACDPTGDGGSGGDGDVSPPPPPPCKPPTTSVESINGNLVINVQQPPPGGGSGSGTPPPPTTTLNTCEAVNKITDSVTNPCLKAVIDNLTNNRTIQTDVTNILRNTFGVGDVVNLTFDQGILTGSKSLDDAGTDGQNGNLTVTFNTPIIAKASKEYLLETTMHEIFHAYLDINPTIHAGLSQHAYMITNYVNTEVATLQQVFPGLSTHDAECLVLAGYATLDPATLNTALAAFHLTQDDVAATNNKYKSGSTGTRC